VNKILVAEDDEISRELIVNLVESLGYIAVQSANGKTALAILLDNPDIRLLICDVMMPELDGIMLIKILRGQQNFADLPIIIISGVAVINEINHLMELGPTVFIEKPLDTSELKKTIAKMLSAE
jgi:chemotaxis family two-component system sensor histidine kinase/response regulator PixL